MNNFDNTIQKLILDVQVRVDKSNDEVFRKFSSIANNSAIPLLTNYFDSIIPNEVVIEIDRLELDLGLIYYEELDTVFIEKLFASLKNIFDEYFGKDGTYIPQSNDLFSIKQIPDNHLSILKYYLLFGRSPWWAYSDTSNVSELLKGIIKNSPQSFRSLLFEIGRNEVVRKRLSFSFHEDLIRDIVTIIEPSESDYIFEYQKKVIQFNKATQTVKAEEKQFSQSVWYVILTYIIYNRGGKFNRREFLKQNLFNLASLYNVQYIDLITMFYTALSDSKLSTAFSKISLNELLDNVNFLAQDANIIELRDTVSKNKRLIKKITNQNPLEEQLGYLHFYLERGSLTFKSLQYSIGDVVSILEFIFDQNPDLFYHYLTTVSFNQQMVDRLLVLFPTSKYNRLLHLITPKNIGCSVIEIQKSFVLFLINRKNSTEVFINSKWKSFIVHVLITNSLSITINDLIDYFLLQLAEQLNLSYEVIFSLYEKDLKRQIKLQEFNSDVLEKIADQLQLSNKLESAVNAKLITADSTIDEKTNAGTIDFLRFLIIRGYIPWWGRNYIDTSLSQLMIRLYSVNSKEVLSVFKFASSQLLYRNRFIQFFTTDLTKNILTDLWAQPDDWKLYETMDFVLQSLPSTVIQISDKSRKQLLLLAFWNALLENDFAFFNTNKFLQLVFLMTKKYHSVNYSEIIDTIRSIQINSTPIVSLNSKSHFELIQKIFTSHLQKTEEEEFVFDVVIGNQPLFDLVIYSSIYGNKKLSKERKINEILAVIRYFVSNRSLPPYLLSYFPNKETLFFTYLLGLMYSLDRNKFSQFVISVVLPPDQSKWFELLVTKIEKRTSLTEFIENEIDFPANLSVMENSNVIIDNDNFFVSILLGHKPISLSTDKVNVLSSEAYDFLKYLLTNSKLPTKYESLARFDQMFLVTILFRFLFNTNEKLFNQLLVKFSDFPDETRFVIFKNFLHKSTHPSDEFIAEKLIPLLSSEIERQHRKVDKKISKKGIVSINKFSISITNQFNELTRNFPNIEGVSRENHLLDLLTYFLKNGKFDSSFPAFSDSHLIDFLRLLILEIDHLSSRKLFSLLSFGDYNFEAKNILLNLFSSGQNIEERRIHAVFQSQINFSQSDSNWNHSIQEFDLQIIDPSSSSNLFYNVGLKQLLQNALDVENLSDSELLQHAINISVHFLLYKKKSSTFKKIPDNLFLYFLKETISHIFTQQASVLEEMMTNDSYPIFNKISVYSLFKQSLDSKDYAIKMFLQPVVELQISNHIGKLLTKKQSFKNISEAVNYTLKNPLTEKDISALQFFQFVESETLSDELTKAQLLNVATQKMSKIQSALLNQVLLLFLSSLSSYQDKREFSSYLFRFNSFILSDLQSMIRIDIYFRRMIQFFLSYNRERALFYFRKFILYTDNVNFYFSAEYSSIIINLRNVFKVLISASELVISGDKEKVKKDQFVLDKISELVIDFSAKDDLALNSFLDTTPEKEELIDHTEPIYIKNAGLVIFNPFITTYFSKLGLIENSQFKDESCTFRAIHLLQLLVSDAAYEEHDLVLNKILCNVAVSSPISMEITFKPSEISLAKELVEIAMQRWEKGGTSSIESFRASFITRDGRLSLTNEQWNLNVEKRGYDVLLQSLPWSFGMIKLPWMNNFLTVEWI